MLVSGQSVGLVLSGGGAKGLGTYWSDQGPGREQNSHRLYRRHLHGCHCWGLYAMGLTTDEMIEIVEVG